MAYQAMGAVFHSFSTDIPVRLRGAVVTSHLPGETFVTPEPVQNLSHRRSFFSVCIITRWDCRSLIHGPGDWICWAWARGSAI